MSWIEGIGDEVVYVSLLLFVLLLVGIAWVSTWVRPLWNREAVWLIQLQTWPTTRVLQVLHLNENQSNEIARHSNNGNTRTVRMDIAQPEGSDSPTLSDRHARQAASEILSAALSGDGQRTPSGSGAENPASSGANGANCTCTIVPATSVSSSGSSSQNQQSSSNDSEPAAGESTVPDSSSPSDTVLQSQPSQPQPNFLGDTRIRLKFLDETQKLVGAWLQQTVGEFKRSHFESDVESGRSIRLIFRGHLLRDDSRSLASYGLHDNCIVHCHVSNTPYNQPAGGAAVAGGVGHGGRNANVVRLDPGRFVFVIFALKFVAIWFLYLSYPQYFDFASFFSLVLCTVIYLAFLFGNRVRARREREEQERLNQQAQPVNE